MLQSFGRYHVLCPVEQVLFNASHHYHGVRIKLWACENVASDLYQGVVFDFFNNKQQPCHDLRLYDIKREMNEIPNPNSKAFIISQEQKYYQYLQQLIKTLLQVHWITKRNESGRAFLTSLLFCPLWLNSIYLIKYFQIWRKLVLTFR